MAESKLSPEKIQRPELAKHDSSVLDLAFAMDCTGSMGSYITAACNSIEKICQDIVTSEKSDICLALVEYRDHPPEDRSFVTKVHDFTSSNKKMFEWLKGCSANGGGDCPEAVADAMHDITKLSWREKSTKICVMISDAPPHGLTTNGDGFPNGCPNGFDPIIISKKMAEMGITLYVVGCESAILPYREFFMSLAYITGGQYLPLCNAKLLSKVIVSCAEEEITLNKLTENAEKIVETLTDFGKKDVSDEVVTFAFQSAFKGEQSKQVSRNSKQDITPIAARELGKLSNMSEMKANYGAVKSKFFSDGYDDAMEGDVYKSELNPISEEQCSRMAKKTKAKFKLFSK